MKWEAASRVPSHGSKGNESLFLRRIHCLDWWRCDHCQGKVRRAWVSSPLTNFPVFLAYGAWMAEKMSNKVPTRCFLQQTAYEDCSWTIVYCMIFWDCFQLSVLLHWECIFKSPYSSHSIGNTSFEGLCNTCYRIFHVLFFKTMENQDIYTTSYLQVIFWPQSSTIATSITSHKATG